jgi:hypothetical protein
MKPLSSFLFLTLCLPVSGAALIHCVGAEPAVPGADRGDDATSGDGGPDVTVDQHTADQNGGDREAVADGPDTGPGPCVDKAPCNPVACSTGVTDCTEGGVTCTPTGTSANGTLCDGGVCFNGSCSPCSEGTDCSEAGSCAQAAVVCSSGAPVCTPEGNALNGAPCGVNLFCVSGTCAPCTSGGSCAPPANPCHVGTASCADGGIVCTDTGGNASNGTSCGNNQVCAGGACVACTAGASCNPGGNVCQKGTTSCATGISSCTNGANVADGTPCGPSEVCSGGACVACATGAACSPGSNECLTGDTSCSTGTPTCTQTGQKVDGTPCGNNEVCSGGQCGACTAGAPCNPNGNVCQVGATSCATGSTSCGGAANAANGLSCGTNAVCFNGACTPCTSGTPCSPGSPPNLCETGTVSCSTGTSTCALTGNVTNGAACGSGGICCTGTCAACSTSTNATDSCSGTTCLVTCKAGFSMCSGQCVNVSNDDSACGASCRACPSESHCVSQQCTVQYGDFTAFSPCATGAIAAFSPGFLLGETVAISSTITLTGLGVIGNPGGTTGILALYTSAGGEPSTLVARTGAATIGSGANVVPVQPPTPTVTPGTYWIMAEYSGTVTLCVDQASTNPTDYESVTFGTVPTTFQPTTAPFGAEDINYYVVGTE